MGLGHAVSLFREYMGTGLVVIWFLVCLVYLFLKEERKPFRILFVYMPAVLLLLFFNPLFSNAAARYMGDEIYYRILWLLPVTAVIGYTCVTVAGKLSGTRKRLFPLCTVLLVMVSGRYIYSNGFFGRAENLYHVPDSVVHICDAIELPGREVTAVFPLELVQYVRQYSPVVCMPYGREMLVDSWAEWISWTELCTAMEADTVDAKELGRLAREEGCVYIILSEEKPLRGKLQDAGYEYFDSMDGYRIYKDSSFVWPAGTPGTAPSS